MASEKGPKWKREIVQDHNFDYIDLDSFYDKSCKTRLGHAFIFLLVIKSTLVYVADFWSAVSLLVIGQSTNVNPAIPTAVSKWVFLAAILLSFVILAWDMFKASKIIKSRDIAQTYTSVIANRYYSMKDYRYFCLFEHIGLHRKRVTSIAFFVFFTLKGWKRLFLAEAPRQVINIVTLQALVAQWIQVKEGTLLFHNSAWGSSIIQILMTATMAFSTVVFSISFILVCVAAFMYIPLICHIRGNLKEYCCHKVDKRIDELLRKQARVRRLAALHQSGLPQNKGGTGPRGPTLPSFDVPLYDLHQTASTTPLLRTAYPDDASSIGSKSTMPRSYSPYAHHPLPQQPHPMPPPYVPAHHYRPGGYQYLSEKH